ncbi:DUF2061 domain-containing protein [Limibaculum sp. M0105]|uniref:DUF2061 domain-containing protein n=1 Tax=Thermohalobaculum xanthum TaxID=2753746 RepID=A0A8J7M6R8_9RHOB|nr:DUF2061 domain-containing protein [Thermohalobaculum xanthum]MBK0399291.1 DUF2061 domain-containing protein [Thermohalobaculum xanthum]
MDTTARTIAKAVCWQALGVVVMTLLGYLFTGSVGAGGALAVTSAAIGTVNYVAHERVWARISWGRVAEQHGEGPLGG